MRRVMLLALAIISVGTTASATPLIAGRIIGIDFGPTAPNNSYNQISNANGGGSFGSFIDLAGIAVDGVGLTISSEVTFGNDDGTNQDLANYPSYLQLDATNTTDWIGAGSPNPYPRTFSMTWTGLRDDLTYNIYGVSSFSTTNLGNTWSADGESVLTDSTSTTGGTLAALLGLQTDGSGNLVVSITAANTLNIPAVANAMVLHAVPEPSSLMASGVGLAALWSLVRRTNRSPRQDRPNHGF